MTTIAWDGTTLATDSLVSFGGEIMDAKGKKLFLNVGIFSALALFGSYDEALDYMDKVLSRIDNPTELLAEPGSQEFAVVGIVRSTGKAWKLNGDATCALNAHWAFGSGASLALAAMDFGKTAKEAVRYAATRDLYTNTRIQSFTVKQKETK